MLFRERMSPGGYLNLRWFPSIPIHFYFYLNFFWFLFFSNFFFFLMSFYFLVWGNHTGFITSKSGHPYFAEKRLDRIIMQ